MDGLATPARSDTADLVPLSEAAQRIGVSRRTIYRMVEEAPPQWAIRVSGRWKVSVPLLERWMHSSRESDPSWPSMEAVIAAGDALRASLARLHAAATVAEHAIANWDRLMS